MFIKQQGGVEGLLQGAAKGIYARGERLGVNQAVRDAMDQVQKNMQNFAVPAPRDAVRGAADRWSLDDGEAVPSRRKTMIAMETRNKQLALMLDEALKDLRLLQATDTAGTDSHTNSLDIAVAKIQFVQVYLEDMSMPLPSDESNTTTTAPLARVTSVRRQQALPVRSRPAQVPLPTENPPPSSAPDNIGPENKEPDVDPSRQETSTNNTTDDTGLPTNPQTPQTRPEAPIPTRSTLAQSSFSWMLESSPSGSPASSSTTHNTPSRTASKQGSRIAVNPSKKPIPKVNRERNAFLFGEDDGDIVLGSSEDGKRERRLSTAIDPDAGFNLGTLKGKSKR